MLSMRPGKEEEMDRPTEWGREREREGRETDRLRFSLL